jgi:gluconokinase
MGVSGTGKTTLAQVLAERLSGHYIEADAYHSQSSIGKMRAGIPLEDRDRWPWLAAVAAAALQGQRRNGGPVFIACSALKRVYRDKLRQRLGPLVLLHLTGSNELIAARIRQRQAHFMPAGLLKSQLAALEPPAPDEVAMTVRVETEFEHILEGVTEFLDVHLQR